MLYAHQLKSITLHSIALVVFLPSMANAFCSDRILSSTPDSQFSVRGQVVVDKKSGLMWKRCGEGRSGTNCGTLSPSTFPGSYVKYGHSSFTFGQALSLASSHNFAGYSDWRLPNLKELRSIVEERCAEPAINASVFPVTGTDSVYWTNTSSVNATFGATWTVSFGDGSALTKFILHHNYVRLVRDTQ